MAGLYVQLDTNWPDNPKVIAAGLDGAGLHASALCLAKRLMTDGVLFRAQLVRLGATDGLIDRLVSVGLLESVDEDRVAVHDWLDRNPSRQAIGGRVGARSSDGKRGNHKRWGHPGDIDDCPVCNPTNGQEDRAGDRGAIGGRVATRSGRIAKDRDRGRDSNGDQVAAARIRAEQNVANVKAMHAETPPTPDVTADGLAGARKAARNRK